MTKNITVTLRATDIEPFLRKAAKDAALFRAWCDYITTQTHNPPSWAFMSVADAKTEWLARFLQAKRIVESFGIEYEPTSEEETLTVEYRRVGGRSKLRNISGLVFKETTGSKLDYQNPRPSYRGEVHAEACQQTANRVVRRWRQMIEGPQLGARCR